MANKTFSKIFAFVLALMLIASSAVVAGAATTDDKTENDTDWNSISYKTVTDEKTGVVLTLPDNMDYDLEYLFFAPVMHLYNFSFNINGEKIEESPLDITLRIPVRSYSKILLYDDEEKFYKEADVKINDGFIMFTVNGDFGVRINVPEYVSTVDEATGIKLEIPKDHEFEIQKFIRGDENIKFDAVDGYTPDGYETVAVYAMAVALEGERMTDHRCVCLAIPVENENYAVFNVSLDYEVTNVNAEYKDGYMVFDSFDFEQGVAMFFLCEKELVIATEDEVTKDEASTSDEAIKDESTFDESTLDEATFDEATFDEATQDEASSADEATKDEEPSKPSDSTPDQSEFLLGDVNRDGKLNIRDATLIQKYIAKISELDDEQIMLADFNQDGKVNVKDATRIQKKIANLI